VNHVAFRVVCATHGVGGGSAGNVVAAGKVLAHLEFNKVHHMQLFGGVLTPLD
jgi:hypothetical protein